jgi:hypothetical protein
LRLIVEGSIFSVAELDPEYEFDSVISVHVVAVTDVAYCHWYVNDVAPDVAVTVNDDGEFSTTVID